LSLHSNSHLVFLMLTDEINNSNYCLPVSLRIKLLSCRRYIES